MTITAKYAATCATCRQPIRPGQQIEWSKGAPARHTPCGMAAAAPPPVSSPTATPAPTAGVCACGSPTKAGYTRCYRCYQRTSPNRTCGTCGGTAGTRGRYGQYSGGTCQCCRPNCNCYDCRS